MHKRPLVRVGGGRAKIRRRHQSLIQLKEVTPIALPPKHAPKHLRGLRVHPKGVLKHKKSGKKSYNYPLN